MDQNKFLDVIKRSEWELSEKNNSYFVVFDAGSVSPVFKDKKCFFMLEVSKPNHNGTAVFFGDIELNADNYEVEAKAMDEIIDGFRSLNQNEIYNLVKENYQSREAYIENGNLIDNSQLYNFVLSKDWKFLDCSDDLYAKFSLPELHEEFRGYDDENYNQFCIVAHKDGITEFALEGTTLPNKHPVLEDKIFDRIYENFSKLFAEHNVYKDLKKLEKQRDKFDSFIKDFRRELKVNFPQERIKIDISAKTELSSPQARQLISVHCANPFITDNLKTYVTNAFEPNVLKENGLKEFPIELTEVSLDPKLTISDLHLAKLNHIEVSYDKPNEFYYVKCNSKDLTGFLSKHCNLTEQGYEVPRQFFDEHDFCERCAVEGKVFNKRTDAICGEPLSAESVKGLSQNRSVEQLEQSSSKVRR